MSTRKVDLFATSKIASTIPTILKIKPNKLLEKLYCISYGRDMAGHFFSTFFVYRNTVVSSQFTKPKTKASIAADYRNEFQS